MLPHATYPEKGSPLAGTSLLEDTSLPAAVIFEAPLVNNITWMQRFADDHGALLAPHGKTTMTPALFRRQLEAGAWGMTLATATQCAAAFAHGVQRILMANQLVGVANMALIAELIERGLDYYTLVDSVPNVEALNLFFGQRGQTLKVLIELGVSGGRCGVRTRDELDILTDAVAKAPSLELHGIEGYEGLISGDQVAGAVSAYGQRLVRTVRQLRESGVLTPPRPIVTAAGSQWFDLIAKAFDEAGFRNDYTPLLRPGCYVTHDHRLYRDAMAEVKARQPDLEGSLEPALAVFAHVQSLPEPGMAIVAMGKRDISCDPDLPIPLRKYLADGTTCPLRGCAVRHIMDQHTIMAAPKDIELRIGDVLAFGASHPCLTFDKWRQVLLVDESLQVREVMPTCF